MFCISTKAQTWFTDFAISLVIFTVALIIYLNYSGEYSGRKSTNINDLTIIANSISSSFLQPGLPNDWNNLTVLSIGVVDSEEINATKVRRAKSLNYSIMRKILGSDYDFSVIFVDKDGKFLNIMNVCDIGNDLVSIDYPLRSAYYYQDIDDSFLKDYMKNTFNSDIYYNTEHASLVSNLSKYSFVVLEHPYFANSVLDDHYAEFNNFTARGGLLMISGELVTSGAGRDLNGIIFDKLAGQSSQDRIAIVNKTDQYLDFNVADAIQFDQYYYVDNSSYPPINAENPFPAVNFTVIATYNKTGSSHFSITKWNYGNGTSYFFSDFDATYFNGDFLESVKSFARSIIPSECDPELISSLNTTAIDPEIFVKIERLTSYKGKIVKMIVSVWQ